ncbi:unnamed protein product, partial [Hymenolepis diminuta]
QRTRQVPVPTLPVHPLSSSIRFSLYFSLIRFRLVVASLNTFWSNQILAFCSTIFVSSYSNSCELATIIAIVIC